MPTIGVSRPRRNSLYKHVHLHLLLIHADARRKAGGANAGKEALAVLGNLGGRRSNARDARLSHESAMDRGSLCFSY